MPDPTGGSPILSEFAGDPDMAELVELFVSEMPARIESLSAAWNSGDVTTLKRLTHQLKGASAGYGFPTIGTAAAAIEDRLRTIGSDGLGDQAAALASQVRELADMCKRVSLKAS